MKKFLLLILLCFAVFALPFKSFSQTNVSSDITSNTTWTKANSPYILTDVIDISSGYTLTIEPGVEIRRNANYAIVVKGAIVANASATDSIVFVSGKDVYQPDDYYHRYFIEFQTAKLDKSSFRFTSFHNLGGVCNNIYMGESKNSEDDFNSGALKITRSNLSKGNTTAKGIKTGTDLIIDSCQINSGGIYGSYPQSQKISISNSVLVSSTINTGYDNRGGTFITKCQIVNSTITNTSAIDLNETTVENSKVSGQGGGLIKITNCVFLNVPFSGTISTNISNSKFIINKDITSLKDPSPRDDISPNYLYKFSIASIANSSFYNYSNIPYNGVAIWANYTDGQAPIISGNTFVNFNDAIALLDVTNTKINKNNFLNTGEYHIINVATKDFLAPDNYFQLKNGKSIDDMLFDKNDNVKVGKILYQPASASLNLDSVLLQPTAVFKSAQNGGVVVTWEKSKSPNIKNYRIYWGDAGTFKYKNSAIVNAADDSYLVSSASVTDSIAITAINTSSTGINDQFNGSESWYAPAKFKVPVISNFTPKAAGPGATLTITGNDFTGATVVSIGGKNATSFTVISSTVITAVVASSVTSGAVSITTAGGTHALAGFILLPPPTISDFTPTQTAAGATVTITGTNFSAASAVTFGGVPAASFTVVSSTAITAVTGAGATGSVAVTTLGGSASKAGFMLVPSPTISGFTPSAAVAGAQVTITGANFIGVTSVSVGGVNATSYTVQGPTTIMATVAGTATSGGVTVTTASGAITAVGFTFVPAPTVASFSPLSATLGATVTITGTNFSGVTAVNFGGTPAQSFTVVSPTTITAMVGNGASGGVAVTTGGGTASVNGFTYITPLPTITGISPTAARAGTTVTITGNNLNNASAVTFGGVNAASFSVQSSTTITAVIGQGASGNVNVTTSGGTATTPGFLFLPVPTITSFSPTAAKAGDVIQILGTNFTDVNLVNIGTGAAASFTVVSPTLITATVGQIVAGGTIAVANANGLVTKTGFTFVPLPVVTPPASNTFIYGTSVNLTTGYNPGFIYQWYKDGVAINGANSYFLGVSASGSYTVSSSFGGITQISEPVALLATFPVNNFKVTGTSVTCKGSGNGSINLIAVQPGGYTAVITNSSGAAIYSSSFSAVLAVSNLAAGTYNVCISAGASGPKQCYAVVVTEPKDLALYATLNKGVNSVNLALSGADVYYIDVNGTKYTNTSGSVTLSLNKGVNDIKVSSDKDCQGIVEKRIVISDDISAYPNPFTNSLTLDLGNKPIGAATIEIYSSFGKMVYRQQYVNQAGTVSLDLSNLASSQIYVLKLTADGTEFINKIVKK